VNVRPALAQCRVEIALTLRRGESLLATLGIPVGVLVFFSSVDVVDTGFTHPLDFLVPGVLALAVIAAGMVSLGIATGFERRYLVLKRLGTTPLGPGGLVAAKTAAVLALEVLQVAVVVGVALALGWDPAGSVTRVVGVAGVLALGTTAFAGLGLLMAGTLRAEATLALTNGLYVAFILVGGIAVPLDRLPGWLEGLSRGLPAAQLAAALRGVMTAGEAVPGWALGGLAAWAVAAPLAAVLAFRWEE
jgi:ABC-2 type transport system permease protein